MAEGVELSDAANLGPTYFCHHCSRRVSPFISGELTCPDCFTGFLERVSRDLYESEILEVFEESYHSLMSHSTLMLDEALTESEEDLLPFLIRFVEGNYLGFLDNADVDALASQLLDEIEISGPPPLSKEQIEAIPLITVSTEQQCTVCIIDLRVGDAAKRLPCEHLFHEKCIVPWLEKQASCPNCRRQVR